MDRADLDNLLTLLLRRLRIAGLPLGIPELIVARRAVAVGFGAGGDQELRRLLQLLWCNCTAHNVELEAHLEDLLAEQRAADSETPEPESVGTHAELPEEPPSSPPTPEPPMPTPPSELRSAPTLMPLPVRTPETPAPVVEDALLVSADPVSRRSMAYTWHYLRRPVKDGPRDQLDLAATVDRVARQGFFDRPVLDRRVTDHGHLILLVDQGGSMVPFHRLTRELIETVADAGLGCVDIGYFQNTPAERIYLDPHRTRSVALDQWLADSGSETSVLVVSDAGAARRGRDQRRFRATARVLVGIKRRTALLAWLNPVPAARWPGTTAQLIGAVVRMYPMDEDGFSSAVEVLRGQAVGAGA